MKKPEAPADPDEAAKLRHANDSDILFSRLLDFAVQGCHSPETLTSYEIKQISFALLTYLALDERDGRVS